MGCPNSPRNRSFHFDDHYPHLIHPSLDRPTHHPNGIRIQSAVLPQYTFRTDRQTDRQMGYRRQARDMSRLHSLDRSDAANNNSAADRSNSGTGRDTTAGGGEWTRPLRALAAQRPLQTSSSTRPQVRYIHIDAILYKKAGTPSPNKNVPLYMEPI